MTEVRKKVSLLGSWHEDVFSDEIIKSISARAIIEKGKKVKVTLNESGIKLTRSRFFHESKSTFFPISDLKIVTRSPEAFQCVLLILLDSERKYKIIALRCSSQADAVHLVNIFSEIQRKQQFVDVELKQKDNGNWTLREKRVRNSGRKVTDAFNDYTPNGEVLRRHYDDVEQEKSGIFVPTGGGVYTKGVYAKRLNTGTSNSYKLPRKRIDDNRVKVTSDEFFIETEVLEQGHSQGKLHTRHNSDEKKNKTTLINLKSLNNRSEGIKRQDNVAPNYVIETEILPYQHSPKQLRSRKITNDLETMKTRARHTSGNNRYGENRRQDYIADNFVIETEVLQHRHSPSQPPARQNSDGTRTMKAGRHTGMNTRYNDSYSQDNDDHNFVIETEVLQDEHSPSQPRARHYSGETISTRPRAKHTSQTEQTEGNLRQDFGKPHIYSAQTVIPSRSIVYTSSSRGPTAFQPVFYREPPRTYDARFEPAAIFYRNPRVHQGSGSIQSEITPSRITSESLTGKYDKRSLRSNNSKNSQSKKKRSLSSYFPSTIPRSIENTYPRPGIIVRPNQIVGYRPRSTAYHVVETSDLLIYPDDGGTLL